MKLQGPIVVGTDFSAASDEALLQANVLADDLGTNLIVCHVVPDLDTINILFPQLAARNAERREILTSKAMAAVQRQVAARLGHAPAHVRIVVDSGTPHAGLLTRADVTKAGVIVVGPGRTADRVARHAAVPTLIARQSPRGVVIGATDFSDPSLPALEAAAAEAHRRGSRLQLLHVVDVGTYALGGGVAGGLPFVHGLPGISPEAMDDLQTAAQTRLGKALIEFAIAGETIVKTGAAAQTIVDLADSARAELVVVGTHGRTGLSRLTLGSTAEAVIQHSSCSVLVVRLAG